MIGRNWRRTLTLAVAGGAVGLGISACSSSTPAAVTTTTAAPSGQYYVSLGDSYAAGFQPTGPKGAGHTTTNGFAYQLPGLASARGYHLTLVNFGCGGATTQSILRKRGCPLLGPGAPTYPNQTQAAAAEAFLTQHPGKVGLVTVSIGGNDLTDCASSADPISCVSKALATINADLGVLLPALRTAAGPNVPIVGTTYPDVILGDYLSANPANKSLATVSVTAFMDLINPALQKDYAAIGASFVDVTAATGAYTPFSQTTSLPPYGTIPVAVARVCQLTFFCQYQDIHPRTLGYTEIATLIAGTLPTR
ncbi:MAG TPA: GDSL-type esterase/lipase family protein [Acidimicrobiales bacterium]|nr:GDSL-type esterase/lipase family protein [Acidimicrobiales bacterium]